MTHWISHILLLLLILQVAATQNTPQKLVRKGKGKCKCGLSNSNGIRIIGGESNDTRILGGQPVPKRKYPWLVFVYGPSAVCTGTLISRRHVLSAAHCMYRDNKWLPKKGWRVKIGDHNIYEISDNLHGETIEMSAKIIKPPKYDHISGDNDIILLKFKKSLKLKKFKEVRPICLPSSSFDNYKYANAICAGWGDISLTQSKVTEVPYEISLQMLDANCEGHQVAQNTICTKSLWKEKSPYIGDSGGPLMVNDNSRYILIGVVSLGKTQEDVVGFNSVAVFTKVTDFLTWIRSKVKKKDIMCK